MSSIAPATRRPSTASVASPTARSWGRTLAWPAVPAVLVVAALGAWSALASSVEDRVRHLCARRPWSTDRREAGQATAEYALVLLGVAAIALMLAAWAAKSGKIGDLFDTVVDQLIHKAS